jgi:hypothetical protein
MKDHYAQVSQQQQGLKYSMLKLLAQIKVQGSYDLLKHLLLTDLPSGNDHRIAYYLTDSLQLAQSLFPEILTLHKDSIFRNVLYLMNYWIAII